MSLAYWAPTQYSPGLAGPEGPRHRLSSPISTDKTIIAQCLHTEQFCFVPEMGLEPISLAAHDFESCVYTIPPLRQCLWQRG